MCDRRSARLKAKSLPPPPPPPAVGTTNAGDDGDDGDDTATANSVENERHYANVKRVEQRGRARHRRVWDVCRQRH